MKRNGVLRELALDIRKIDSSSLIIYCGPSCTSMGAISLTNDQLLEKGIFVPAWLGLIPVSGALVIGNRPRHVRQTFTPRVSRRRPFLVSRATIHDGYPISNRDSDISSSRRAAEGSNHFELDLTWRKMLIHLDGNRDLPAIYITQLKSLLDITSISPYIPSFNQEYSSVLSINHG